MRSVGHRYGIDQAALLVNGDSSGRRDYNFVDPGNILAATTKGRFKRFRELR